MKKKLLVITGLVILTTFSIAIGVLAAPALKLMINGKASSIQIKVIDNVNYVPLNSFAASLGYDISTNTNTNTINVTLKKSTLKPKASLKATAKPTPKPTLKPTSPPIQMESVYYKNCTAVKAAGKAPLYRGDPGYSTKLDRDKDGVACE